MPYHFLPRKVNARGVFPAAERGRAGTAYFILRMRTSMSFSSLSRPVSFAVSVSP
jgi:hypothetical protein